MDKWVPVAVVVASGAVGLVVWLIQKNRERKDQQRQRKQALYESLLTAITELYSANAAPLFVESQLAWLYASDKVLNLLNVLFVSIRDKKSESELQNLLGELLLEMRRDVFNPSTFSEDSILNNYEAVTAPREDVLEYLGRRTPKLGVRSNN